MKYRGNPQNQVKYASELIEEGGFDLHDMTVTEYLRRLNLSEYAPLFSKKKIFFLSDLRFYQDSGSMMQMFGMNNNQARRMASMMNDEALAVQDFALLSSSQARQILKQFIVNQELLEEAVNLCEHEVITGFQLKDICTQNYDFDAIKSAIQQKIFESRLYENPNALTINLIPEDEEKLKKAKDKKETPEERKKRIGVPTNDIFELLKEVGLEATI